MVHFGKDVTNGLGETILNYGNKALFMYGQGSVKKTGIYDKITSQLVNNNIDFFEYGGIRPNPEIFDVDKAAEFGRKKKVEVIVAVGGGSVIDSAKITGLCIPGKFKGWDVMTRVVKPKTSIPLIAVLTLSASGSEMNQFAVLQNSDTKQKTGYGNPLNYPRHTFLDPQFTFTVPSNYTAYGIVDLIAHALEAFFAAGDSTLSDRFVEAIVKEAMHYAPLLLKNLKNYEYRSKISWAASCALNGLTAAGRKYTGDWGVHDIGHTLSFLFDIPHGASLSIAYTAWLKYMRDRIPDRIRELGVHLFNFSSADKTILKLTDFFRSIDCPIKLGAVGISTDKKNEITGLMKKNQVGGMVYKFTDKDYPKLVELMF
jgi:alcohol dehydrogenase YqhD (iron-dependent ADH family)